MTERQLSSDEVRSKPGLDVVTQQPVPSETSVSEYFRSILSFPRRRESRLRHWIPACAGMTEKPNLLHATKHDGVSTCC